MDAAITLLDSSSLKFWETVANWGMIVVIIGVAGEGVEIIAKLAFHRWHEKHEKLVDVFGFLFWVMVVVGLAIEFRGDNKSKEIADRENAQLTDRASSNELKAAESNLKIEELRKENFQLRAELARVDSAATRRVMTSADQQSLFLELQKFAGTQYEVTSENDNEVDYVVKQLTEALDTAGWKAISQPTHFSHPPPFIGSQSGGMPPWPDQIIRNGISVEAVRPQGLARNGAARTRPDLAADALVAALNNIHMAVQRRDDWQKERPWSLNTNVVFIRVGFRLGSGRDGYPPTDK